MSRKVVTLVRRIGDWMRGLTTIGCIAALLSGCESKMSGYLETLRSANPRIPEAMQIEKLFGSDAVDHFITHYGMSADLRQVWNTQVFFGGRYYLTMQVPVSIDYKANTVSPVGEARFFLVETERIEKRANGGLAAFHGDGMEFGPKEWSKVAEGNGNFHVIGFELKEDEVKGFSSYVQSMRRNHAEQHVALLEDRNGKNRVKQPRSE